jgi:hypothetical protein
MGFGLSTSIWSSKKNTCWCACAYTAWFQETILSWCWLITKRCWSHLVTKRGQAWKGGGLCQQKFNSTQRKFHPMEGECYALIWGIMHFRQYLHRNHFILKIDHKPLEWLATMSGAHGRRGRWIDMLQDLNFKILHRPGFKLQMLLLWTEI